MKDGHALRVLTEHCPPRGTDRKEEIETGLLLQESQVCDEKWSIFTNRSRTFRTGVTALLESMARTAETRGERESTVTPVILHSWPRRGVQGAEERRTQLEENASLFSCKGHAWDEFKAVREAASGVGHALLIRLH